MHLKVSQGRHSINMIGEKSGLDYALQYLQLVLGISQGVSRKREKICNYKPCRMGLSVKICRCSGAIVCGRSLALRTQEKYDIDCCALNLHESTSERRLKISETF